MRGASGKPDRATHEPSQQAVSAVPAGIPSAWHHVLEDGSFDHEWVTEFGITFCAQCEIQKDHGE